MTEDDEIWRSRMGEVVPFAGRSRTEGITVIDAPVAVGTPETLGLISSRDALDDLRKMRLIRRCETPWPSLTAAIGLDGWMGGEIYTIVGGTGAGKTTFAIAIAKHFAEHHGDVIYVTDEMRPGHCLSRAAASALGVSSNDLIRGDVDVTDDEIAGTLPSRFWFMRRQPLSKIREAAAWLKKQSGFAPLIVVDYIGKLAAQVMAAMERPDPRQAMTATSNALCEMAQALEAPIIALSAGGRGSTAKLRGSGVRGKRTDVRDLPPSELVDTAKESSDVEYDAGGLITLSTTDDLDCDGFQIATVTVAKARFGRMQHIAFAFDGPRGRWIDRGPVLPKSKEQEAVDLSAERTAELNQVGLSIIALLKVGPMSVNAMQRSLKKRRAEVLEAVAILMTQGVVEERGRGPSSKIALTATGAEQTDIPAVTS